MNDTEIWKAIPGWEGYSASSLGNIRSEDRVITENNTGKKVKHSGKLLKPWIAKSAGGYFTVGLCNGGDRRLKISIHRLVLLAFVGPLKKGMDSRHLDGNCLNNRIDNLAYGTRQENLKDAVKHLTMMRPQKLTKENVLNICQMGMDKVSAKIIADKYDINRNTVTEILRGEIWKHVTKDLTPISNYHRKHDKLSLEHLRIVLDSSIGTTKAASMLEIDRHTLARWRKKFIVIQDWQGLHDSNV